ncbi:unannotated protein [freshwater metagenome]|uniref:Unannotated protein n=1 Tax=freshwater metagenome TaxID=449393 RepID=A0A6J7KKN0_9ZZZZ
MLADRLAPLDALRAELAGDAGGPLGRAGADGREGEAAGVQGLQSDLQALALLADEVLGRDEDVLEQRLRVLDALETHELVAVLDRDALGVVLEDERRDAAAVTLALRDLRHDHDDVGDRAVRRPELAARDAVARAVLGRDGRAGDARRVGADVGLRQEEGGDVVLGDLREPLLLLLLRAGDHQRLGDADGLVRGEEGAEGAVPGADHGQGAVVVDLGEPEAAVLLRDLHAEGAELLEPVDDLVRDLRVALDLEVIDLVGQEALELLEEDLAARRLLGVVRRQRVHQVEAEVAEVELLAEGGQLPVGLARLLGELAGLGACRFGAHEGLLRG